MRALSYLQITWSMPMGDQQTKPDLCSRRPSLDDLDLIAAIDGEADEEVIAHLHDCPRCAARARDFDQLQGLLRQRLYRILCFSSDDLLAYQQGWLVGQRRTQLQAHLRDCPHCAAELHLLAVAAPEPLPAPIPRLRRVVAVAQAPHGPAALAPVYGGMRGATRGGQYAYRADNLELTLDVQRTGDRTGRVVLVGMVFNDDDVPAEISESTASLLRNELVVNSAQLDELGNFVLEDITPGDYSLSLRLPDLEVVIEALAL
jgi:hypothetical protein